MRVWASASDGARGRRAVRVLIVALAVAVQALAPRSVARADDSKVECLESFERGQRLRHDGKLIESRAELRGCARASCPAVIQTKCAEWAPQVDQAVPTVVVTVREAATGADRPDATLLVDGLRVATRLDGSPLEIDPGEHVIGIVPNLDHARPMSLTVRVVEGERGRLVRFAWPEGQALLLAPTTPAASVRPAPIAAYVLSGVSVAALASFAGFGGSGLSDYLRDKSHCAPGCNPGDESWLRTRFVVADVSLGFSILSAAASGWLFFHGRTGRATTAELPVQPVVTLGLGGAGAGARLQF